MNSKFIVSWFIVAVVILGGLWYVGKNNVSVTSLATTPDQSSQLVTDFVLYDFGTISMRDGLVKKEFLLTNSTESEVTLTGLYTSCMCTAANVVQIDGEKIGPFGMQGMDSFAPRLREALAPGESRSIEVVYNPNAHGPAGVGPVDRFVTVQDSTGVSVFEIKAMVTP